MGGTSTINLMVHTRGNKKDYDNWYSLGNPGWSYNEVLPYFIKSEKITGIKDVDQGYHGKKGYVNVEHGKYSTPLLETFKKAGRELGYDTKDTNGRSQLGFSQVQANLRNGRRCSASKAYIRPIKDRRNLHVSKESRVTKILVDPSTKKAFGVEFIKNRIRRRIRAKKEVILSAGSISSPQLLMLSGVGPKEHLEDLTIQVFKDLKVGYNLQDHPAFSGLAFLVNESFTINDNKVQNVYDIYNYLVNHKGPFTLPGGSEGIAFMKSKYNPDPHDDYPDIEIVMGPGALNGDTLGNIRRILGYTDDFYEAVYKRVENVDAFSMVAVLLNTRSRGRIMLKSKNPFQWPLVYTNMYQDPHDVKVLIEGVKLVSFFLFIFLIILVVNFFLLVLEL